MMAKQYSGVIFDMDGVLIDARDWHFEALNESLRIFGEEITYEEHLGEFDGLPTKVKLQMLEAQGRIPSGLFDTISSVKQERTLRAAAKMCFPRVEHLILIGELKRRGLKVGVATNSIRSTASAMLEFAGLLDLLDVLVTNEDVSYPKPSPEIYQLACDRLSISPDGVLVFEDNHYGIAAAQKAGCDVVHVEDPNQLNLSFVESGLRGERLV